MKDIDVKTAIHTIIWYDSLEEWLGKLLKEIQASERTHFRASWSLIGEGQERAIWELLVMLYGDWGTSVGSGWIEEVDECQKFLQEIYDDIKEI